MCMQFSQCIIRMLIKKVLQVLITTAADSILGFFYVFFRENNT